MCVCVCVCVCVFQAEYDAMLQEFAGEGIPLLASAAPAELFWPFLSELLPLITNKAVSLLPSPWTRPPQGAGGREEEMFGVFRSQV